MTSTSKPRDKAIPSCLVENLWCIWLSDKHPLAPTSDPLVTRDVPAATDGSKSIQFDTLDMVVLDEIRFLDKPTVFNVVGESVLESLPPIDWAFNFLQKDSPEEPFDDLRQDGFGLVVWVLREIKTMWKHLLTEMEDHLKYCSRFF
jgi:hypothetical protein